MDFIVCHIKWRCTKLSVALDNLVERFQEIFSFAPLRLARIANMTASVQTDRRYKRKLLQKNSSPPNVPSKWIEMRWTYRIFATVDFGHKRAWNNGNIMIIWLRITYYCLGFAKKLISTEIETRLFEKLKLITLPCWAADWYSVADFLYYYSFDGPASSKWELVIVNGRFVLSYASERHNSIPDDCVWLSLQLSASFAPSYS